MRMSFENSSGYGMMGEMNMRERIEDFTRKAPKDMFRVIGEDIRTNNSWLGGDFPEKTEAIYHANSNHGDFVRMHVYDDQGEKVDESKFFASRFIH